MEIIERNYQFDYFKGVWLWFEIENIWCSGYREKGLVNSFQPKVKNNLKDFKRAISTWNQWKSCEVLKDDRET